MIIKYGNTDITNLLLEYKRIGDIDNNNLTLLGNTPSYQIDIKIDNDQAVISSPDELITIYEDDVLKGTYFIYEAPEKYTKILSLTCFDFMLFLNTPYDSKITYPTTIKNQLDEISNITGLTIDYTNLDVLNQEVNWYDNTLACRDYVGWIAEVCGMNSYADERGIIKFKKITSVVDYETEDIGDYDIGDFYKVSRVCFDNGILKLETGSNLNNTLYLSSNNPYIDTTNNPVEKIYDMYKDLSIYSINDLQAAGLDYVSLFDVLKFSDYKVLCLSVTSTFKGGSYQIQDIDGVLPSSNADKVTIKYDATTRMKKIEVLIDQNSQTLEIVAKEQEGLNDKYSTLVLDTEGIKQAVKQTTEKVESLNSQNAEIFFYLSTSNTSTIGGTWSTAQPSWAQGKYIWQKTKYTFANGTSKESSPVCVTGNTGQDGTVGKDGIGVSSITPEYYLSTSKTTQIGGTWSTTPPTWSSGKYVWTRSKTIYTNNTLIYSTPFCDSSWEAINDLEIGSRNLATKTNQGIFGWGWMMQTGSFVKKEIIENDVRTCKITRNNDICNGWSVIYYTNIGRQNYVCSKDYTITFEVLPSVDTSFVANLMKQNATNSLLKPPLLTIAVKKDIWNEVSVVVKTKDSLPEDTDQVLYLTGMDSSAGVTYQFKNLRINSGNKRNDWTPAPEDTDERITTEIKTVTDKQASFDVLLTGITGRVSNTEQTITTTRNELNNLQIGGRNLLPNTKDFVSFECESALISEKYEDLSVRYLDTTDIASNSWKEFAKKPSIIKPKPNGEYTFSFYAKGNGKIISYFYYGTGSVIKAVSGQRVTYNSDGNIEHVVTNKWERYYVTYTLNDFDVSDDAIVKKNVLLRQFSGSKIYICGWKIEEGNRPTPWTPAVEDIDKNFDDLDKTITETKSQVSSLVLDYNGFKTNVSETYTSKTEFDNLRIGGRNLLLNSATTKSNLSLWSTVGTTVSSFVKEDNFDCFRIIGDGSNGLNGVGNVITKKILQPNTDYCYSFWCKVGKELNVDGRHLLHIQCRDDSTQALHCETNVKYEPSVIKANVWTLLTVKFNVTKASHFVPYLWYLQKDVTYFVRDFMVEQSNKVGTWTPAPEDIDADIQLVDGKFVNYSTTTQMNSAITQTAKDITQTVSNTYATLSNVGELTNRVTSAESKLTSSALITTISGGLNGGSALTTTKYTMDLTGLHIKGGGLDISNNAGAKVLYADVNGNLVMNNLTAKNGNFEGNVSSVGSQGFWAKVSSGMVVVGKDDVEYGKLTASWNRDNTNFHHVSLVAGVSSEELHLGTDNGDNSTSTYYRMKAKKTIGDNEYRHQLVGNMFADSIRSPILYLGAYSGGYKGWIGHSDNLLKCVNNIGETIQFVRPGGFAILQNGPMEMYAPQPYIDFHFANDGSDFSTRIICNGYGSMGYFGSWNALSDRRKKRNIMSLDDRYINLLMHLDPCKFIYQYNSQTFDKYTLGYVAQDVTRAIKEVGLEGDNLNIVAYDEINDTYSMSYNDIEPIHTLAIQKLIKGFYELRNENTNLKQRLEQLEQTRRA